MSKLGLVIVLILMAGRTDAQNYFVLIDADNGQPFYVRVDSQLYSSSAQGHLILSQLKDSGYTVTIGFPGQIFPERQFFFSIRQKDHSFRLKREDGKGWWLIDDQGQELSMPDNAGSDVASVRIPGIKKDDAFSRLMADLVKDTAVMYSTYATEQPNPAPAGTASAVNPHIRAGNRPASTAVTADTTSSASGRSVDTSATTAHIAGDSSAFHSVNPTVVTHSAGVPLMDSTMAVHPAADPVDSTVAAHHATGSITDSTLAAGRPRDSSFTPTTAGSPATSTVDSAVATRSAIAPVIDSAAGHTVNEPLYRPIHRKDTASSAAAPLYRTTGVTMLTEHRSSRSLRQVYTDHNLNGGADTVVVIIPLDTPAQTGRSSTPSSTPRVTHPADSSPQSTSQGHGPNSDTPALGTGRAPARTVIPFVNSDCHNFATDYDVDKLRVKMLESGKDDDRIQTARKIFKTKCFSTHQIRALSEVFTTDASKFRFLEAAYPFVSDDHFAELSSLLADPVYNGRFRAMTGHP